MVTRTTATQRATRDAVRASLEGKRTEPGAVIFHQGEPGDTLYLIQSGAVEYSYKQGGTETVLTILEKESLVGEMSAGHSLGEYSALCAGGAISRRLLASSATLYWRVHVARSSIRRPHSACNSSLRCSWFCSSTKARRF